MDEQVKAILDDLKERGFLLETIPVGENKETVWKWTNEGTQFLYYISKWVEFFDQPPVEFAKHVIELRVSKDEQ